MRLWHVPIAGAPSVVADEVELASSWPARARGLMFRRSFPEGHALVFRFDTARRRALHMAFVPFPIDAAWLDGEVVTATKRLRAWVGLGRGLGDTIVECPAGALDGVEPGDRLRVGEPEGD
ncbi:MAG: DUF192 domain-containing protein [Halobacteriota archaeon]